MTDRQRQDLRRHTRFVLASLGAAALLGSLAGASFSLVRMLAGVMDGAEEPL